MALDEHVIKRLEAGRLYAEPRLEQWDNLIPPVPNEVLEVPFYELLQAFMLLEYFAELHGLISQGRDTGYDITKSILFMFNAVIHGLPKERFESCDSSTENQFLG